MNWVDISVLAIVFLSAVISVIRGFVREALSLAAWIAAFWVAFTFTDNMAVMLADHIETPSLRLVAGFTILFLATLIIAALVNFLAVQLVVKTGLSGTDRMLGVIFGIARGVVIVGILVLLAGLTPIPQDPWWEASTLIPHFEALAILLRGLLPPDIAAHFVYH